MLAENVDRLRDGRLVIYGGDFDTFEVSETPVSITFTLLVKVITEAGESLDGHTFSLELSNPAGVRSQVGETLPIAFEPRPECPGSLRPGSNLIVRLNTTFLNPGVYFFHIVIDGDERAALPVQIRQNEAANSAAEEGEE